MFGCILGTSRVHAFTRAVPWLNCNRDSLTLAARAIIIVTHVTNLHRGTMWVRGGLARDRSTSACRHSGQSTAALHSCGLSLSDMLETRELFEFTFKEWTGEEVYCSELNADSVRQLSCPFGRLRVANLCEQTSSKFFASKTVSRSFPAVHKDFWCEITAFGQYLPVSAAVTS